MDDEKHVNQMPTRNQIAKHSSYAYGGLNIDHAAAPHAHRFFPRKCKMLRLYIVVARNQSKPVFFSAWRGMLASVSKVVCSFCTNLGKWPLHSLIMAPSRCDATLRSISGPDQLSSFKTMQHIHSNLLQVEATATTATTSRGGQAGGGSLEREKI